MLPKVQVKMVKKKKKYNCMSVLHFPQVLQCTSPMDVFFKRLFNFTSLLNEIAKVCGKAFRFLPNPEDLQNT